MVLATILYSVCIPLDAFRRIEKLACVAYEALFTSLFGTSNADVFKNVVED